MPSEEVLKAEIGRMFRFFGGAQAKRLDEGAFWEVWSRAMARIPDEAITWMVDRCVRQRRYAPTPDEFLEYWTAWKHENPQKLRARTKQPCDYCRGEGLMPIIRKDMDGNEIKSTAVCGHCGNALERFDKGFLEKYPPVRLEEIEATGGKLWRPSMRNELRGDPVRRLAGKMGV